MSAMRVLERILILVAIGLVSLSVVILVSAGDNEAYLGKDPSYVTAKKQGGFILVGALVAFVMSRIDYKHLQRYSWWIVGLAVVLLALCFAPVIGHELNGSSRWLNLGVTTVQPSEFAKLAVMIFLCGWFGRAWQKGTPFHKLYLVPAAVLGVVLALILGEMDLGCTLLIGVVAVSVVFVAGVPVRWLVLGGALAAFGLGALILQSPERIGRIRDFYILTDGEQNDQQKQGLVAIKAGGLNGMGVGKGDLPFKSLPVRESDFVFCLVAAEMGLKVTFPLIMGLIVFVGCGIVIAMNARDRFGTLLASSMVLLIGLQAVVNLMVTNRMIPNKGMPLPFVSAGGSNMLFCAAALGVILSVCRYSANRSTPASGLIEHPRITPKC